MMVCERRGVEKVESWLIGQIHAAAMNWQMLDKVHNALIDGDLTVELEGSNMQTKCIINPLFPTSKELQRTMILHY